MVRQSKCHVLSDGPRDDIYIVISFPFSSRMNAMQKRFKGWIVTSYPTFNNASNKIPLGAKEIFSIGEDTKQGVKKTMKGGLGVEEANKIQKRLAAAEEEIKGLKQQRDKAITELKKVEKKNKSSQDTEKTVNDRETVLLEVLDAYMHNEKTLSKPQVLRRIHGWLHPSALDKNVPKDIKDALLAYHPDKQGHASTWRSRVHLVLARHVIEWKGSGLWR